MKKLFLLLAVFGLLFSACTEGGGIEDDNGTTEQPGSNPDDPNNPGGGNDNPDDPNNPGDVVEKNNKVYYTTYDDSITSVKIAGSNTFGANLISNEYQDGQGVLTFDNTVTSIGERAFEGCTSLTSITIPDSVTEIGGSAFSGCTSLTSITIPDSVTSIGYDAFEDYTGELIINSKIVETDYYIYDNPSDDGWLRGAKFTKLTIGDSVTKIGDSAFYNCTSLTSVTIPDSVTEIGGNAFRGCTSLTSITIGNGVTSIDGYAFLGCESLTSITIPDSVSYIGHESFKGCASLTSITIGNGVTCIESWAFNGCSTSSTEVYCKATTPPTGSIYMFYDTAISRIYVPKESVSAYKSAEGWKAYAHRIFGYDFE